MNVSVPDALKSEYDNLLLCRPRSALEFYEGGCQEKVFPADGEKKFSLTSRPS
jgi:hypothetical protein